MKIEAQAIFSENLASPSCHAATLVETRRGLLAAWFAGSHEGSPDVAVWLSRLEGSTWSKPCVVADVQGVALWNPVLFRDLQNILWLFYKIGPDVPAWSGAYLQSQDDGCTWSKPVLLPAGLLGPAKNKPIQLTNGDILCGTSHETWNSWACWVELSSDLGKTWRKYGPITAPQYGSIPWNGEKIVSATWDPASASLILPQDFPGVIQPAVWEYAPGKVRMLVRATQRVGWVCLAESLDGGRTWGEARKLSVSNPNSGLDAVRMADGRIALVCNPVEDGRTPLSVLISKDNGETWTKRADLETQPGEYSYPAVIQAGDGSLNIAATYQRRQICHYRIALENLEEKGTGDD